MVAALSQLPGLIVRLIFMHTCARKRHCCLVLGPASARQISGCDCQCCPGTILCYAHQAANT